MNLDATIEKACRLIAEAADDGAQLIAFPEAYVPAYPYWVYAPLQSEAAGVAHTELLLPPCSR